jgi:hypothetical protein
MPLELRLLVVQLQAYVLYPLWLAAGAVDYWCHRRTKIEETSGATEGWLHVLQFLAMAIIVAGIALLEPTIASSAILLATAVAHVVLSYIDVSYTQRRRYISPLEQHVHAFMDVLPVIAALMVGMLALSGESGATGLQRSSLSSAAQAALLGSFAVLAGGPVVEEFFRTLRAASHGCKAGRIDTGHSLRSPFREDQ